MVNGCLDGETFIEEALIEGDIIGFPVLPLVLVRAVEQVLVEVEDVRIPDDLVGVVSRSGDRRSKSTAGSEVRYVRTRFRNRTGNERAVVVAGAVADHSGAVDLKCRIDLSSNRLDRGPGRIVDRKRGQAVGLIVGKILHVGNRLVIIDDIRPE